MRCVCIFHLYCRSPGSSPCRRLSQRPRENFCHHYRGIKLSDASTFVAVLTACSWCCAGRLSFLARHSLARCGPLARVDLAANGALREAHRAPSFIPQRTGVRKRDILISENHA
jgi:hypothetical protein